MIKACSKLSTKSVLTMTEKLPCKFLRVADSPPRPLSRTCCRLSKHWAQHGPNHLGITLSQVWPTQQATVLSPCPGRPCSLTCSRPSWRHLQSIQQDSSPPVQNVLQVVDAAVQSILKLASHV